MPVHAATFKARVAVAHRLVNASDAPVRYLIVGTRATRERVTYPRHELVLHVDRIEKTQRYSTMNGDPADKP